jgi:hypothetical protein
VRARSAGEAAKYLYSLYRPLACNSQAGTLRAQEIRLRSSEDVAAAHPSTPRQRAVTRRLWEKLQIAGSTDLVMRRDNPKIIFAKSAAADFGNTIEACDEVTHAA